MRIGTVFPQTELHSAGEIRDYSRAIEDLGYHRTVVYDHVVGAGLSTRPNFAGPFSVEHCFHEVFALMAFVAAHTTELRLSTGVLVLPQRQTVLVARQAAEVDLLSDGRLDLGVGVGWNEVEFTALGASFHDRGRRFTEQVEVLRRLWTEKTVDLDLDHHRVPDAGLNPMPVQRPIPLLIGVGKASLLRRVARLGDGWVPFETTVSEAAASMTVLAAELAEVGKSVDDFPIQARIILREHDRADWRARIEEWRALGVSDLSLVTSGLGLTGWGDHVKILGDLAAELELTNEGGSGDRISDSAATAAGN